MSKENKPKILCVDDEKMNLKLLKIILEMEGYDFQGVERGEIALAQAAQDPPDLILLDVMMPKMTGYDVLLKLRADEQTRLVPVVMLTALRDVEDRVKALEAGCDDFISKPFDKIELLARVRSLLKINYYRRQLDEKEKFKAVLDKMSDGIAVCDPDWILRESNAVLLKYLNINDMANVNLAETLFKNYSVSIPKEALLDLTRAHKTFDIVRGELEKAKALVLEANLDAVKNPAGEISSIVLTLRDVSTVRRGELLKQDFLSLISHKLRSPLTVFSGRISLLHDGTYGPLNDKQKEAIDTLYKYSFTLIFLVEKLLGFIMFFNQNLDKPKETIELKSYLPAMIDVIVKQAEHERVELNIDCREDVRLAMNKLCFDQVMGNLVENAVKFNDKEVAKISVIAKKVPGKVEISIADNGPGIPNEEYEHVFESFYQVEKHFSGQVKGIGLGLAIVKKLIEREGGEIKVRSVLGEGSTFVFTLPAS